MKRRLRIVYAYSCNLRSWHWVLAGPQIGSRGFLLFSDREHAVSHARFAAQTTGATVRIQCPYGAEKILEIEGDRDAGEGLKLCGTL